MLSSHPSAFQLDLHFTTSRRDVLATLPGGYNERRLTQYGHVDAFPVGER